jgi:23S rRNA (guanosine2251-2'-O)-methyltransferase
MPPRPSGVPRRPAGGPPPHGPDHRGFRVREPHAPSIEGLIGEDEELVAGRHPVEEAFLARRKSVRLLVVPQRRQALEKLVLHATNLRIPIIEVEGGTLTALAGFDGHQGVALVTDRRTFAGLDDIVARAIERSEPPFVLVLDSLEDPQNFGSLIRTAEAAGVHGIVYPTHRQAPLSPAAVKASAGAVEHLLLAPVDDLAAALTDLRVRGLRVVGSDADAPLTARQADLRGPLAVVVGSEGQGLGPVVRRRCDAVVRIPMKGRVSSLNAAVAGSILMYEAASQRGTSPAAPEGKGAGPAGSGATPPAEAPELPAEAPAEAPELPAEAPAEASGPLAESPIEVPAEASGPLAELPAEVPAEAPEPPLEPAPEPPEASGDDALLP